MVPLPSLAQGRCLQSSSYVGSNPTGTWYCEKNLHEVILFILIFSNILVDGEKIIVIVVNAGRQFSLIILARLSCWFESNSTSHNKDSCSNICLEELVNSFVLHTNIAGSSPVA